MPASLYRFIWQVSRRDQILLSLLTLVVAGLSLVPLELQRRIVNDALDAKDLHAVLLLCGAYLVVLILQGGLKYWLNVARGFMVERVALHLRHLIFGNLVEAPRGKSDAKVDPKVDRGAVVSMTSSEVEEVAGFVGDSISVPLLQAGTALGTLGYLFWVQPEIAAFAVLLFLPQVLLVPLGQRRINRWAANHARLMRKLGDVIVSTEKAKLARGDAKGRFHRLAANARRARVKIYWVKFGLTALGNFIDAIGPLIVLSVGGWLVLQGKAEVGTLVVFISGFQRIADPWDQLLTFYRTTSNARVKYGLIADAMPNSGKTPNGGKTGTSDEKPSSGKAAKQPASAGGSSGS